MHVTYHHGISKHQILKETFQNLHKWRQNFRLPHESLGSYWHSPQGFLGLLVLSAFSAASHSQDLRVKQVKMFTPTTVFAQSQLLGASSCVPPCSSLVWNGYCTVFWFFSWALFAIYNNHFIYFPPLRGSDGSFIFDSIYSFKARDSCSSQLPGRQEKGLYIICDHTSN